jgi:hypothetical protein
VIRDLVSPWLAAVEGTDTTRARATFRARHAALLEALRLLRAPDTESLPLATDAASLRRNAQRAADPETQQLLRDAAGHAVALGADRCDRITLLAGDGSGTAGEAVLRPEAQVVLFVEIASSDTELIVAMAGAAVALTRWSASRPIARQIAGAHDRWEAARAVPLREWIYTEGIGLHLAAALRPDLPPHELLGLNHAAFTRLRERERVFRALLDADLDAPGIGPPLRWLAPGAPLGARTVGDVVLPPMAGRYLAWRMTAERVARIGLREALLAES